MSNCRISVRISGRRMGTRWCQSCKYFWRSLEAGSCSCRYCGRLRSFGTYCRILRQHWSVKKRGEKERRKKLQEETIKMMTIAFLIRTRFCGAISPLPLSLSQYNVWQTRTDLISGPCKQFLALSAKFTPRFFCGTSWITYSLVSLEMAVL